MNVQFDNASWLTEAKKAYEIVKNEFDRKELEISNKQEIYKYAPVLAAQRRDINDNQIIDEMKDFTEERVKDDFFVDPEARQHYLFYFIISYVQAHIPPGLISEKEGDDIMDYINDNWDLFENDW